MNIPENFDRWMFDYKEGNLSGAEMAAFENFMIQNPQFEVDADAWNQAFVPNEEFVYPNASNLQKDRKVAAAWFGWSTAAVIAILLGSVYFLAPGTSELLSKQYSSTVETETQLLHSTLVNSELSDDELNATLPNDAAQFNATNNGVVAQNSVNGVVTNPVIGSNSTNQHLNGVNTVVNGTTVQSSNGLNNNVVSSNGNLIASNNVGNNDGNVTSSGQNVNTDALIQEINKFDSDENSSKYQGNPIISESEFDFSKKESYDHSSWQNKVKKVYRKIEKMFDYPVGLTNLRDPELLLPNSNITAFNPAFTGGMLSPRFEMNYRNQWLGSEMNSQQMSISFDNYIYQMRGGIGITLNAKDYGLGKMGDYSVNLTYSPKILLSKDVVFEPAVKLTLGALNVNGDALESNASVELERGQIFNTPAQGTLTGNQQQFYKDYGLGFVLNTKWFYAGFSADNLNKHYAQVYNEEGSTTPMLTPIKYSGIVGFDYEAKRRPKEKPLSFSPFVAYQQFGSRKEIWAGSNFRFNSFTFGGSISQKKDFTASIGMKFERFKLVYHYDHTYSTVLNKQIGSHNVGIRINGRTKKSRIK